MTTLTHSRAEEIKSFLDYHDYSLAVRRLLDMCLDSGDDALLMEAINLSQVFRNYKDVASGESIPEVETKAIGILAKLEETMVPEHKPALLLRATDITKRYSNSSFTLKPTSLEIFTSDVLGVVGQNGHGKTTLLRCIAGQLALDGGTLEYPQLVRTDYYSLKHNIAFIPQRIPRWYGQLKDNLHFSAAISGVTGRQNELIVDFMLERLNLTPFAHLQWTEISSGYRTRFEIARVLLQRPSLLILDEPLANLDINAQQTILTDLRYMAKSIYQPMGVILSSQQLHEVEKIADTVLLIKNGACLFRTGEQHVAGEQNVLEIETTTDRDRLADILGEGILIQYNGGFYTITSKTSTVSEMIALLLSNGVQVTYFRDITHSTKRFF